MEQMKPTRKRSTTQIALLWGAIAILVIAGLLLPPISLGKRLFQSDYERLTAEEPQISHPDGITLRVEPGLMVKPIQLNLGSIPRVQFVGSEVPEDWRQAAAALPAHLILKSPVYIFDFRDQDLPPVHLDLVIPNDAEPYHLLDIYTWDGAKWSWASRQIDVAADSISLDLPRAPLGVAVLQAGPLPVVIGLTADEGDTLPQGATDVVTDLYPGGLSLGPAGMLLGQPASFDDFSQYPSSSVADPALVHAMLADSEARQAHIRALVDVVRTGGYPGLNLAYPGVTVAQRESFSIFVRDLASQLEASGLDLVVTVPYPMQAAPGVWDTAGYDWRVLGSAADRLVVTLSTDPATYDSGGATDDLLRWAVSHVPRTKLLIGVNALGIKLVGGIYSPVDTQDALAPLAESLALKEWDGEPVEPGADVMVGLEAGAITMDPATGTYQATYIESGEFATVWLPSPAGLTQRLRVVTDYHLGGIVLHGVAGSQLGAELLGAVSAFLADAAPQPTSLSLAWAVQDQEGAVLSEAQGDLADLQFAWQAAEAPGTYLIQSQFSVAGQVAGSASVEVPVAEATAVPTVEPTAEPTAQPTPTATPVAVASGDTTEEATPVPPPDADAIVAGSVVNLREGPSTAFAKIGSLPGGTALTILAINPESTWLRISASDGSQGWIYAELCTIYVSLGDLPVESVPTPTPPPTPEGGAVPPPSAPPPSSSGGFELGGHIRSWNYLGQMGATRMNWVKVQVHYGQDASGMVASAHANGFKIQLSALGPRDMVNQGNFHNDYGAWVAGMAAAGADAIEVWNEPNIEAEWPLGQISPVAYTQLLCSSYNFIKNANGGTAVISAAPAPTGYFGGCGPNGCDDLPWLQGLVNAGALNCMDYVGAHHNAGATSPSATSGHPADGGGGHHSWYFLPQTQLYYNVFGGARKLFYTEMGYASQEGVPTFSDWFAWARGINNAQQAAWLAEAVTLSRTTGMVRCIIVWNIDFARYGDDPQDGYAIIRPDGSCPACGTLAAAMGG